MALEGLAAAPVRARIWRLSRVSRVSIGALVIGAAVVLAVLAGPLAWSSDPVATDLRGRLQSPSLTHPLGTDEFGRDLLARVLHGGRRSVGGSLLAVSGSTALGLLVGVTAGAAGRRADAFLGRTIDALMSLPSLVIALAVVGVLGKSFANVILALILTGWPWYARVYRSFVLRERGTEYVLAARAVGCSPVRIMWRHIGPNIAGAALVLSSVNLGNAVLGLASLSFLGLGVQPPEPEWGAMVSDARGRFDTDPWLMLVPGLAIAVTVLVANLMGDAMRELTDPRARSAVG